MSILWKSGLMVALCLATGLPAGAQPAPVDRAAEAAAVRAEFLAAWQAYVQYAWGHDELRPVSKGVRDWYGYLLFAPDDTLDLDGVVFNTEAHPLRPVR